MLSARESLQRRDLVRLIDGGCTIRHGSADSGEIERNAASGPVGQRPAA